MTLAIGTSTPIIVDPDNKIDYFEKIPNEMLLAILSKLDERDLDSTFLVNKRWSNITIIAASGLHHNFLNSLFGYGSDSD